MTAAQAMDAMEAVSAVLKARFNNLSAMEVARLSKEIVKAIIREMEVQRGA
jgi:hypothetical protein